MMQVFGKTDRGIIREENQDDFAIGTAGEYCWAAVCDGMGGANGGKVASSMAAERFKKTVAQFDFRSASSVSIQRMFDSAITSANVLIYDRASSDSELEGMGTTVVAAVVGASSAYIAHVGDSRAYLISENEIKRITRDHSVVQTLVDNGTITDEEARLHEKKNLITRAVGVDTDVDIEFDEIGVSDGDIILLCSDGLSNMLTDSEIKDIVLSGENAESRLIEAANAAGGTDNITAVLIMCTKESE